MSLDPQRYVGATLADFRITKVLGQGATAVVFRGENVHNPRIVRALKVVRPEFAEQTEFVARFKSEAAVLETLQHPNVRRFHGLRGGQLGPYSVLAMELEFLDGDSLDHVMRKRPRPLPIAWIQRIAVQAAAGLAAAHAKGIVHRDIKPENLFVVGDDDLRLLDFGIARALDDADRNNRMTRAGHVPGTPAYMAPEVCQGAVPDAAADVYALGLVIAELLLGRHPLLPEGTVPLTATQFMLAQVQRPIPDLRASRADAPAALLAAVTRACAKNPQERFRDAGLLHAALSGDVRASNPSGAPSRIADTVPLSTEFQVPSLPTQRASGGYGAAAAGGTDFAVPTIGTSQTTEPFTSTPAAAPSSGKHILLGAGGLAVVVLIAGLVSSRSPPRPGAALDTASQLTTASENRPGDGANHWVTIEGASPGVVLGIDNDRAPETVLGFRPSRQVLAPTDRFLIQQHEVTLGEFDPVIVAHPEWERPVAPGWLPQDAAQRARLPATGVSWQVAQAFCRTLGGNLPTEEQWEWAARGADRRAHPWGSESIDLSRTHAYRSNGALSAAMSNDQDRTPGEDVGALFDLAGNAREWTLGVFRVDTAGQDESWVQSNGVSFRAVRGLSPNDAQPAALPASSATWRDALCANGTCPANTAELLKYVGFRCARRP